MSKLGGLTYGHFTLTGIQDANNAYDPDDFVDEWREDRGASARQIVDRVWAKWEAAGMMAQWIVDNADLFEDLDPEKCYVAWASGWKKTAESAVQDMMDTARADVEQWYLAQLDPSSGRIEAWVDRFDTEDEAEQAAVRAFKSARRPGQESDLGHGLVFKVFPGDGNGPWRHSTDGVGWKNNPSGRLTLNPSQRALITNPAWVTKALSESYSGLEDKIPANWLPKLADVKSEKGAKLTAKLKEYGCGAYGCVLPTLDEKVVLKVTIDDTEADFAARLAETLVVPVTCAYYKVVSLPAKRKGSRIFLLWREEAKKVDQIDKEPYGKAAVTAIAVQHRAAQTVFDLVDKTGGNPRLPAALKKWVATCEAMGKVSQLKYLSDGMLRVYREQGIFFGDIHEGNVGLCVRDGKQQWVITDPGHVAVFGGKEERSNPSPVRRRTKRNPAPGDDWTYDGDDPESMDLFDGAAAYERQEAVRSALIDAWPALESYVVSTVHGRMSPEGKAMIRLMSQSGIVPTTARMTSHGKEGKLAELTSVFVVPWDYESNIGNWEVAGLCRWKHVEQIFGGTIGTLNKHWTSGDHEWWWGTGAQFDSHHQFRRGNLLRGTREARAACTGIYEFSMGKKPWRWLNAEAAPMPEWIDFSDIRGNDLAVTAAERAVSTRQNLLLVGAGNYQAQIARRITTIMPGSDWMVLPFRAPHHSISTAGLLAEAAFARNGVFYLDEIHEFRVPALRELATKLDHYSKTGGKPLVVASSRPGERMSSALTIPFPVQANVTGGHTAALRNLPPGESSETIRDRIYSLLGCS